jgi:NADP-dependent 3-hydroxy acid dehydrogenase YdfG
MTSIKSRKSDLLHVVITGASSGIGAACAEIFARSGHTLILGARRLDRLETLAPHLRSLGAADVWVGELDVTKLASIEQFQRESQSRFGGVDVLINNAGLAAGLDPVATGSDDDWEAMMNTNVLGLLKVSRAFLKGMIAANHGHIFNMGSIAGFHTYAKGAAYAGSKHAVRAISGALRQELTGTAIRISEIDPGMVETEFSLVRLGDQAKADEVYRGMTPLTAADVAECVYFAATRPPHVNIDHIVLMPTDQSSIGLVHRRPT